MKITIPVYHYDEVTENAEDLGIKFPIDTFRTRPITFYKIDAVEEDEEGGSIINCSGELYITPLTKEEVEKMIEEDENNSKKH